ncbi:hypothetical protein BU16DRAFT_601054 [Lophium mytilinum]|uniref:Uncharacterized protein n=1 Tax=Lophium mytilinum TaxID=390894 RepID=A0A6A6QAB3_9PEZI|nr:hypothetical protein BU16DRAFT_601054 [Lophium mytilinum]
MIKLKELLPSWMHALCPAPLRGRSRILHSLFEQRKTNSAGGWVNSGIDIDRTLLCETPQRKASGLLGVGLYQRGRVLDALNTITKLQEHHEATARHQITSRWEEAEAEEGKDCLFLLQGPAQGERLNEKKVVTRSQESSLKVICLSEDKPSTIAEAEDSEETLKIGRPKREKKIRSSRRRTD